MAQREAFIGKPSYGHCTWAANIPLSDGKWQVLVFSTEAEAREAIKIDRQIDAATK